MKASFEFNMEEPESRRLWTIYSKAEEMNNLLLNFREYLRQRAKSQKGLCAEETKAIQKELYLLLKEYELCSIA
jgi:hypothetical protein